MSNSPTVTRDMRSVTIYYHENKPAEVHLVEKIAIEGIGTATRKAQLVAAKDLDAGDKRALQALTKRIVEAAGRQAEAADAEAATEQR